MIKFTVTNILNNFIFSLSFLMYYIYYIYYIQYTYLRSLAMTHKYENPKIGIFDYFKSIIKQKLNIN